MRICSKLDHSDEFTVVLDAKAHKQSNSGEICIEDALWTHTDPNWK